MRRGRVNLNHVETYPINPVGRRYVLRLQDLAAVTGYSINTLAKMLQVKSCSLANKFDPTFIFPWLPPPALIQRIQLAEAAFAKELQRYYKNPQVWDRRRFRGKKQVLRRFGGIQGVALLRKPKHYPLRRPKDDYYFYALGGVATFGRFMHKRCPLSRRRIGPWIEDYTLFRSVRAAARGSFVEVIESWSDRYYDCEEGVGQPTHAGRSVGTPLQILQPEIGPEQTKSAGEVFWQSNEYTPQEGINAMSASSSSAVIYATSNMNTCFILQEITVPRSDLSMYAPTV